MLAFIPSVEALERFKEECKLEETNLLSGKCQLCADALLFMIPISLPRDSFSSSMRASVDEISPNIKCPLSLSGDPYLLELIRQCVSVKIVYPSSIPFNGFLDLSLFESCTSLELVRIPFGRLTGVDSLRNRLRSLLWIRGFREDANEDVDLFANYSLGNRNSMANNLKVDEIFWDQFGTWPLLNYLCISQCNISYINVSTMPPSIKTLDLRMNRIYNFSNLANYSMVSTITKLCLDFNSLKELPKLNENTCSTLVHLSLRGNLISSVAGLRNFSSLEYLDLSENSICDLRQVLNEFLYLCNAKTVYLEQNPVCHNKSFVLKCQSVLHNLNRFNGKFVKQSLRINYNDPESIPLPVNVNDLMIEAINSDNGNIEESVRTQPGIDESLDRTKKSKVYKERFVVINDEGEEETVDNTISNTSVTYEQVQINVNTGSIPKNILSASKKNYLFGGVSGSYSSFNQLVQSETLDVSNSLQSQHLTEEVIEAEKNKLLQKRIELGDDWLISRKGEQEDRPLLMNLSTKNNNSDVAVSKDVEVEVEETETTVIQNQSQIIQTQVNLDETSEWDEEDTEDENTVFLVEIYSSESEYNAEPSGNYFFIRVRPRDGLLFEKDCTSGKILTTLDLKILEHFQCLPTDVPEADAVAIRFVFDTTITSKRERIYSFVEKNQCGSFVQLYLKDTYGQFKHNKALKAAEFNSSTNSYLTASNKLLSTTPMSRTGNYSWAYMCLRCGFRTSRIITDCPKCHSELIIKDEGTSSETNNFSVSDSHILSNTFRSSTPNNSEFVESGKLDRSPNDENELARGDSGSMGSEENFENEPTYIDESYFRANIDHYLKLHIEIYIYEQIGDIQLQPESIESMCHCMALNFVTNCFTPVLVVFTTNYIFVFDYEWNKQSHNEAKEGQVKLRFYRPLVGPMSSPFIISHLPGLLKNQAFWLECDSISETKKKGKKKKPTRTKQSNNNIVELLLFDDKCIGKAFLQLFLQSHRICLRSQKLLDKNAEQNLIVIKADITELSHLDDESADHQRTRELIKRKVGVTFDESCQKVLNTDLYASHVWDESPSSVLSLELPSLFLAKSFNLVPCSVGPTSSSNSGSIGNGKGARNGLFKVEQNLVFLVTRECLALCKINGHFPTIGPVRTNNRSNESIARALQSGSINFEDRIEFRLLIKDLVVNLLPNIFIDKSRLMLVLRFRDEDHHQVSSHGTPSSNLGDSTPRPRAALVVYDFQIQFNNLNTMKRATKLIQSLWEEIFDISLTLSKHVPLVVC